MKSQNVIQSTLQALGDHRELIEKAYERGTIDRTSENARAIIILQQHQILVPNGHDQFRLSGLLVPFLRQITNRASLYESLGENIVGLHNRTQDLRREYSNVVTEGRIDDVDFVVGEFQSACFDLADAVSNSLTRLLIATESRFGVMKTLAGKMKQNEHYLLQAEKLSNGLSVLERSQSEYWAIYGADSLYDDLTQHYNVHITSRLKEWSSEILRIVHILRTYLFKLRQVEPDVRRLRQFADFLQQNPGYEPPDITDNRELPDWLQRDTGGRTVTYADTQDESCGPELEAIALRIPPVERIAVTKREPGTLDSPAPKDKVKISAPAETKAMISFTVQAIRADKPLSARGWYRTESHSLDISEELWLFMLLAAQDFDYAPFNKASFAKLEGRQHDISQNLFVRDIHVHGKVVGKATAPVRSIA